MSVENQRKLQVLKDYDLPLGQYVITGSGPLGVRGLRELGDVDILVTEDLWDRLAERYGIVEKEGVKSIPFPGEVVEAFSRTSFSAFLVDSRDPSLEDRLASAEWIEGLPFESLEHLLYFKRKMGRVKDLQDIETIQAYLSESPPEEPIRIVQGVLSQELERQIMEGFSEHSIQAVGSHGDMETFVFCAKQGERLAGALVARTFWGAWHIKNLWISAGFRGKGLGLALMKQGLDKGREFGCAFAFVETLSFQAVGFYKKLGFVEDFVRHGYSNGVSFHYLQKKLGDKDLHSIRSSGL